MAWDNPWFVGGNAKHSEQTAREFAFIATGGAEGVARPGDLKVVPTTPPSSQVLVSVGGVTLPNRGADSYEQSYIARLPVGDPVDIAPTDATGARSTFVAVRVEDPNVPGGSRWQGNGADAIEGPFMFSRAVPNVPKTATKLQQIAGHDDYPGYAVARIDQPANTATITADMIVDLRQLSRPRSEREFIPGVLSDATVTLSTGVWRAFPTNPITGVTIPDWATHAAIRVDTTIRFVSGDAYANVQAFLGGANADGTPVQDGTTLFTDLQIDSTVGGGQYRQPLILPSQGLWPIPAALRGTTAQISARARAKSANGGVIGTSAADYLFADITFMERAA